MGPARTDTSNPVGDFFQLAKGDLLGATVNLSGATLSNPASNMWITTLIQKGILFVEPVAGTTIIKTGVILPIGDDTEFNTGGHRPQRRRTPHLQRSRQR